MLCIAPLCREFVLNGVNVAVLASLFSFGTTARPSTLGVKDYGAPSRKQFPPLADRRVRVTSSCAGQRTVDKLVACQDTQLLSALANL